MKIPNSVFMRQVLTLISGTTISQVIPFLLAPILTRLYTPNDFGVLALFSAVTAILSIAATARYELGLLLPKNEKDVLTITILALVINLIFTIISLILIIVFRDIISTLLNNSDIANWLYLVPFVAFFMGFCNTLSYLNLNYEKYNIIASANVLRSISLIIVQIGIGLLKDGPAGLVLGKMVSYISNAFPLSRIIIQKKNIWTNLKRYELMDLAKKYIQFPKFSLPASLINIFTQNVNNFFISILYASNILGFYSLFYRVLDLPINVISNAFAQVLLKKATESRTKTGNAKDLFLKVFIKLGLIGLIIFIPLYFIIEDLFVFIFGPEWFEAGVFAKIMLPLFYSRFVVVPLSTITIAFEKQKENMLWQISLLLTIVCTFIITNIFDLSVRQFLLIISLSSSIHYLILLKMVYYFSGGILTKEITNK